MSDINLRFDGLILLLALAVGAVVYCLIAIIAQMAAIANPGPRLWKVATFAGVMCAASFAIAGSFLIYRDHLGPAVWADQLTYPWALVFIAGCWILARIR